MRTIDNDRAAVRMAHVFKIQRSQHVATQQSEALENE